MVANEVLFEEPVIGVHPLLLAGSIIFAILASNWE